MEGVRGSAKRGNVKRQSRRKLRRQYSNVEYPEILLRFEDGHEIRINKGRTKSFDAWSGETIRIVALWDPTAGERVLVASRRADEFEIADPGSGP